MSLCLCSASSPVLAEKEELGIIERAAQFVVMAPHQLTVLLEYIYKIYINILMSLPKTST